MKTDLKPHVCSRPRAIPTYSPDGTRRRDVSLQSAEHLVEAGRAVVIRNRRGAIACVQYRDLSGGNPMRSTTHMGQSYTIRRTTPHNRFYWEFKEFVPKSDIRELLALGLTHEQIEFELQAIFRAVPLSCIQTYTPAPGPEPVATVATVVPIDTHRSFRKLRRLDTGTRIAA